MLYLLTVAEEQSRMYRPSLTTVVSVLFLAYMANSMWNIVQLYLPPPACPEGEL